MIHEKHCACISCRTKSMRNGTRRTGMELDTRINVKVQTMKTALRLTARRIAERQHIDSEKVLIEDDTERT